LKNGTKTPNETKTLVLIVAYEAESHIAAVLNRLPGEIWNNSRFEVLCIDDASRDSTAELATKWRKEHQIENIVVLKNRNNQGYGGNQKLGYKYAMDHDFDYVVLLHGDGQYAPELVAEIAKTMAEEKSDVYLGARTWSYWNARSGGMPRYKYFGNKILTWVQNLITGKNLIEYHTGLRGYSVPFLKELAFALNSNDFYFDTEILLQAFYNEAKIIERPIPVHYGDEVCRVNGPVYAAQVFLATLHYALINFGILNSPQYRRKQVDRYIDKAGSAWSSHGQALSMLAKYPTKKILDIGCGNGSVARRMMQAGNLVHGMDRADYHTAAPWSGFSQIDLDRDAITLDTSSFDAIVCLDVIEHLKRPEELLLNIREAQKGIKSPVVLLCTPNIAFITVRLALLLGFFNYSDKGILDIDHSRLFSRQSFLRMIRNSGYDVLEFAGIPAPWDFAVGGRLGRVLVVVHGFLARLWPSMFAFQMLVSCRPRPNLSQIMSNAREFQNIDTMTKKNMEQTAV